MGNMDKIQLEASLKQSNKEAVKHNDLLLHKGLFKSINDAIVLVDAKSKKIVDANDSACRLYGYTIDELLKMGVLELENNVKVSSSKVKRKANAKENILHQKKSGKAFSVKIQSSALTIDGNDILVWVIHEVLQRKPSKLALQEKVDDLNQKIEEIHHELSGLKDQEIINTSNIEAMLMDRQDSVLAFDKNFNIIYFNRAFQNDFQKEFKIALKNGLNLLDLHQEEKLLIWKQRYERALQNESFLVEDALALEGDRLVQLSFNPIHEKGEIEGASCFGRDITDLKQSEALLKQEIKNLVSSQRIAQIGIWRLNVKTNEVVWSEELYKMYGFDLAQAVPPYDEHVKLFAPESWEHLKSAIDHTKKTGMPYELELKTITLNGSNGWMWFRGEAELDEAGNLIAIWGAAQDITERKQAEEKFRISEERFREIVKNLNAGVVIYAPDGSIIECNDRATILLGLNRDQLIGSNAKDADWTFVDEQEIPLTLDANPINVILKTKKPLENYIIGIDHTTVTDITWVMVNGIPIFNDVGNFQEIIVSFMDYTEVKTSKNKILASEEQYRLLTTQMQLG